MQYSDCNLRPLMESDLEQILIWRNSEIVRLNMYNDHIIPEREHREWFEKSKSGQNSKHLVFEYKGNPVGVINITQIDLKNNKCYWGFYLGDPQSSRGYGFPLGFLGLEYIFKTLAIRKVCGEAFAFNEASIKFHKKLGFTEEGLLKAHILKNGKYEDVICFALFKNKWLEINESLAKQYFEVGII